MKLRPNLYDDTYALHAESRGEYERTDEIWRGIAAGAACFSAVAGILWAAVWIYRSVTK
jgi:hypothetical protein